MLPNFLYLSEKKMDAAIKKFEKKIKEFKINLHNIREGRNESGRS